MSMRAKPWEVSDELWERIEPLLPRQQRRWRYPGRRPLDDRLVLQGILFVLHTGIGWEHLPQQLGFGCGMTAPRCRSWHHVAHTPSTQVCRVLAGRSRSQPVRESKKLLP
jgi:transposase